MNYNLQKSIDVGLIHFYDAGQELVNNILENLDNSSQDFLYKITEKMSYMSQQYGSVNVIFNGVSHLFDLQFNLRQANKICKGIIDLVRSYNNNSFALFHCYVAMDDDATNLLANLLSHKAEILAEVESLSSGLSSDVSGHLTFKYLYQKYQRDHLYSLEPKMSQYLYKLFDRGVKLLAPGTV
uniref:Elongator complex protein 6 n=2 Tax=Pararge aegeria TaxID=116150 RepID=S4PWR9_9NEOP